VGIEMRKQHTAPIAILIALLTYSCSQPPRPAETQAAAAPADTPAGHPAWGIVIHTGAGNFSIAGIAERKDAVQAALVMLEDSPHVMMGLIGLDAHGNVMLSFNTTGMGRGYVGADGKPTIMFTADDK
jgi:hypothetical protein